MQLSYQWLSQYVDLKGITPQKLAKSMTQAGIEVEGLTSFPNIEGLVIGEICACQAIAGTHLYKTQVDVGCHRSLQIVCGAPNCRQGLKTIVALEGAELPAGRIISRSVHGVESRGMLCALSELGVDRKWLSQKQLEGIAELADDAPVGETNIAVYAGLDDTILDVSLTPNRADCSAMWNMAMEVGAILKRAVTLPDWKGAIDEGIEGSVKVEIQTPKCSRYMGKVIRHVQIGPSPKWLQNRLRTAGINSINNIVDISNYVMLETGQPLHFYDLARLQTNTIRVVDDRKLSITALDGASFAIMPEDILICDGDEAIGIAGIMGGKESMIDETTTGLFIEAAHFDAATIRHTAVRLNLMTEASQRFMKGVEEKAMEKAMARSVQLLKELALAEGEEKTVICGEGTYQPVIIRETLAHCNGLLGTSFTMKQIEDVLHRLHFQPQIEGETVICHIPSYRMDMKLAADVDEEVIRLLGFDTLPSTLPSVTATVGALSQRQRLRRMTADTFLGMGLHEIVTYTLVSKALVEDTALSLGESIALSMPMSDNRRYIRTGLMGSMLECVQYNQAHGNKNNLFFEISSVYAKNRQEERLALCLEGNVQDDSLHHVKEAGDFYALKGMITAWLKRCGYTEARIVVKLNGKDLTHFHPYRSAEIWLDNVFLGLGGEVHPIYAEKFDLKRVVYAELSLDALAAVKADRLQYVPLDKYPSVERDMAVVVSKKVSAAQLLDSIHKVGGEILRDAKIFDIYEGASFGEQEKSVALRLVYQAKDHTLKEEEIERIHANIAAQLSRDHGAQLRT